MQKGIVIPTLPAQDHAGKVFPFYKNELSVYVCVRLPRYCLHALCVLGVLLIFEFGTVEIDLVPNEGLGALLRFYLAIFSMIAIKL